MEEIALAKLTERCVEVIFTLLGWGTADDKDNVFSYSSKVLGPEIDLRDAKLGYAAMRNTGPLNCATAYPKSLQQVSLPGKMANACLADCSYA